MNFSGSFSVITVTVNIDLNKESLFQYFNSWAGWSVDRRVNGGDSLNTTHNMYSNKVLKNGLNFSLDNPEKKSEQKSLNLNFS